MKEDDRAKGVCTTSTTVEMKGPQIMQDLKAFYTSGDLADCTIVCQGECFPCHAVILASRSPVFRSMFQSNMAECATRTVRMDDLTPGGVQSLLQYLYTDTTPNLMDNAFQLLHAAEKYQFDHLKKVCVEKLQDILSIKNVLEILIIADTYGVEDLKKTAVNYILTHAQDVITGNWKVKLSNNKDLALELLEHVAHRGDHIVDDKVYTVDRRPSGCFRSFRALGTRKILAGTFLFILWLVGVGLLISSAAQSCEVYYPVYRNGYQYYRRG